MRYEDASHTGAFQGSQPIANDDLESLPAGTRSAATGNLITGEGTQTGSAGADMAAGAHITAIAGKSGEDSSFSGGKLSVSGEFGKLSVDKDGDYSYQANAGVENVRDRFTYTLADNNGATDTASLIVEIGKTPVVIKANAQQIVPGPDGVVTLPPGVELSDIRVVGRNLVIDMPDGTQLIIIDGAIFVPQLVLGGVEVPSTNVAALLIGQEPQPAAGEAPQSSGGNFASPVPPLDPGVPLGDLIPPTEYNYIPPEPQPPLLPLENDEVPTIQIQPDGQPASVNAVDSVDEDGLPTRNGGEPEGSDEGADGNPSNNSDTDETTAGTIIVDSPDGVGSVTINGVLVTGVIGQVIPGDFGNLTITGFSGSNILYSYTLTDNTSGDNTHDDFTVVLTDPDGDTATATLTIDIIDDVPTARDDTDATVNGVATGNVITDAAPGDVGDSDTNAADTVGADNATLTAVSGFGGSSDSTFEGGLLNVNGQFGVLTIDAQGNYTYTVNPNAGGGGTDVFTYTLTDGDGDTTQATLTITNPDLIPDVPENTIVGLDDDALAGGNPGTPAVNDDPDSVNTSGSVAAVSGDGIITYALSASGAPAGFSYALQPNGDLWVLQGATHVLTVTLDQSGNYTVSQVAPIDHAAGNLENNADFTVTFSATDADGDSDSGTLSISVDDDTPIVNVELDREGAVTVDESGPTGASTIDFGGTEGDDEDVAGSGPIGRAVGATALVNANALFGADGPSGSGLSYSLQLGGSDTDLTLTDGSAIELQLINGVIVGMVTEGSHSGEAAFAIAIDPTTGIATVEMYLSLDHPDASDSNDSLPLGPNTVDVVVSATDGDGDTVTSDPVDVSGQFNFLDDGPSVNAVLSADGPAIVDESPPVADATIDTGPYAKGDDPDLVGGQAIGSGSTTLLVPTADFGADGPAATDSLTFDLTIINPSSGLTLTDGSAINLVLLPSGVVVGVVSGGAFDGQAAFAISIDSSTGTITAELYLSLDHPDMTDPDDILTLAAGSLGAVVTATDGDGDTATSGVIDIGGKISFLDDGPLANDDTDTVSAGTATGNVITGVGTTEGALNADSPGADGFGAITQLDGFNGSTDSNPSGGFSVNGEFGTLQMDANGNYTYTRTDGLGGGEDDVFTYTYVDGDGDPISATLTISIPDSVPDVPENTIVGLDDDALTGGNPGTPAVNDDPDSVNTSGSVAAVGGDGTITYALSTSGAPVGFSYALQPNGDLWVLQGATHVLTVTLDQSGNYTVSQVAPIDHAAGNLENNTSFTVTFSATDVDLDSDSGTFTISVDDDSPVNFSPVDLTDDTGATVITQDDALVNDGTANVTRLLNDANNNGVGENFIGADGFGSLAFSGGADGDPLLDASAVALESGGLPIYTFGWGTDTLTATTSADNSDPGAVVFTATLNEGAGYGSASTYTIDFNQPIDNGGGFVLSDFSDAPAGQNDWIGVDSDGGDINDENNDSPDILLTPTNAGGTVNTSATDIGNANQWIDSGEGIRVDFVTDVRRDGANDEKDAQGYTFDGHFVVSGSSFQIMQTQGGGDASVRIAAFNDPDSGNIKTLGGAIVPIDQSSIVVTGDATYTIVDMGDGTFVITGLNAGANIAFNTNGVDYDAVSITSAVGVLNPSTPSPIDTFSGAPFAIGVFGFFTETAGNPIDLSLGVTATDADGDTSTGTIDITLVPDTSSFAATSFSSLSSEGQLQKIAANSNTLTVAAAVAAAGVVETQAAAAPVHNDSGRGHHNAEAESGGAHHVAASVSANDDSGHSAVSKEVQESVDQSAPVASSSHGSDAPADSDHALDDSSAKADAQSSAHPAAANDQGPASSSVSAGPTAPAVAMVSAEALKAEGLTGHGEHGQHGQHGSSVEQVVAEALGQGNAPATVDALLNALPGGNGSVGALANVASPAAETVSAWNMSMHGAFGAGHDMIMNVHAAMHHDAVQPVANG